MNFISLCSGIDAASLAFGPLGWKALAFSEIEKFPSAVIAHHYPTVPNLGDMRKFREWPEELFMDADAIVGGPPCQAFSVAGARRGLADARGNLTLVYVELLDHADAIRRKYGKPPVVALYENVVGILSDKTNAFGCLVAGLAGEYVPVEPPGARWTNAGCVFGPERAIAWRTFDAQFFGVAQRRRRVFVVASARPGFDPAQVLFEWHGVRRDSAPSRQAREVAPTIPSRSLGGGGLGTDFDCDGGLIAGTLQANGKAAGSATQQDAECCGLLIPIQAFGGNRTSGDIDIAPALLAQPGGSGYKNDFESETFLLQPTHSLRAEGFDASEDGTVRGTPLVPVAYAPDVAGTLVSRSSRGGGQTNSPGHQADQQLVAFDTTQITSRTNGSNPQPGAPCHSLAAGARSPAIAFTSKDHGGDATADMAPTMRAMGHSASHQNGGGQLAVAAPNMGVRRLTPTECERLMGMPDGYTQIPWRGKPADQCPDGPRYKALGNSWVVPNITWIGQRIHNAIT